MNPFKIIKYGKYFSESRFLGFLGRYGKKLAFVQQAVTLFLCFRDKDTPKYVKAVIAGALGYLVLPIDIVPDTIAVLGWVDDVAVLGLALRLRIVISKRVIKKRQKNSFHLVAVANFYHFRQFDP